MILLFFIYIDFVISRYRFFRIIVNFSSLFRHRDDNYIIRIFFFRVIIFYITFNIITPHVTSYITLFFFIIITLVISKN